MALTPDTPLGPYEILAQLGAGGMGEVYRAKDTKLGRDVALKILPASFTNDPERVARFRREAQVLASLNHPHIGQIYGLDEANGTQFLVLELVDGESLDKRIARGRIPLEEALGIAKQIAEALEAAHEKGIIHRDLKPANIALTKDGNVKVLDFGLAKAVETTSGAIDVMNSPTITSPAIMTGVGMILGTAAYISPEQAKGRPADRRADIWAFGAVLYEILSGQRAFSDDDVSVTLALVIMKEPDLTGLPPNTPAAIRRLLRRCLQKDRSRRLADIADARLEIDEALTTPSVETTTANVTSNEMFRWKVLAAIALLVSGIVAGGFWLFRPRTAALNPLHQLSFGAGAARTPALSPDGKLLAYASDRGGDGQFDIWLKQMAGGDSVRLTRGSGSKTNPQFSPDGTKIYYLSADSIFEMSTLGGPSRRVIDQAGPFSLSSRGDIGFYRPGTASVGPMFVVPGDGGTPEAWQPDCISSTSPMWSPDGDQLLFAGFCGAAKNAAFGGEASIEVAPRHGGSRRRIGASNLPSIDTHVAWFRLQNGHEGVILPARVGDSINLYQMSLDGRIAAVTHGTGLETWPVVSSSGELIFVRAEHTPVILSLGLQDASGTAPTEEITNGRMFGTSRDGGMLVYGRMAGTEKGQLVLRVRPSGNESVLAEHTLTLAGAGSLWPQVSPDAKRVIYRAATSTPGHYLVSTDGGTPRFIVASSDFGLASDWSPDGKRVIGECTPTTNGICELDAESGKVRGLLKDPQGGELLYPSYSWDGKWVAFMLRRSGRTVICATPVRADGNLAGEADWVQISSDDANAARPRFSPDESAIYYELNRDDARVLIRQTFDPTRRRPTGDPVQIAMMRSPGNNAFVVYVVTVTRDRVFFNMVDTHSNVWMTQIE